MATRTHRRAPPASIQARSPAESSSPPKMRMARPRVMATSPEAVVASPLIWPLSPLGIVLPCTSFDEIEPRHRPREKTASAAMMRMPAVRPSASAAVPAMKATAAAWIRAPATNTHLRCVARRTIRVRRACGSIEPDSRIGTSTPVSEAGTPRTANSQGRTVDGLTIWSPEDWSAWPSTCLSPFEGMLRWTSSGISLAASGLRLMRRE